MSQVLELDIRDLVLSNGTFGPRQIDEISASMSRDYNQFLILRDAVNELASREDRSPASAVRLGAASYLCGRYKQAKEVLERADGGALAQFYLGKSLVELEEYENAVSCFRAAAKAGYNLDACALAEADA
jgi:DNA-directed RNA polymerase subunit alpha